MFVPTSGSERESDFTCFPDTRMRNRFPAQSLVPNVYDQQ
jgi:hypothetical protein